MAGFSFLSSAVLLLAALTFVSNISLANVFVSAAPAPVPAPALAVLVQPMGGEGSLKEEECGPACDYRCSETSHKKPCLFYCNKCCDRCLWVPSGTYGNKEECPCYNDWKTDHGKPKCP